MERYEIQMLEFPLLQGNIIWIFPIMALFSLWHHSDGIIPRPDLSASHGLFRNLYLLRLKGNILPVWQQRGKITISALVENKGRERKVVV